MLCLSMLFMAVGLSCSLAHANGANDPARRAELEKKFGYDVLSPLAFFMSWTDPPSGRSRAFPRLLICLTPVA